MAEESQSSGNPLIILGDKIAPTPHLTAFVKDLKLENSLLDPGEQVKYAICSDTSEVATTLKKYQDDVKMVLIGPGLRGNGVTVARMLATKAHIVMIIDPRVNPLGDDPSSYAQVQANLEELKIILSLTKDADQAFFQPLIKDYVVAGMAAGADLETMSPEERAKMIDKRLDAVNAFPSLPDTQRKVAALDDLDPPKKWAEAIDDDIPTKTVILRILNSARYGFRSRVETIDQAVALASARTIREIVTACQIRQIFSKTSEGTIDQFWRHSLSVAYFAKLLSLPADPAVQNSQQKTEFERYQLEEDAVSVLQEMKLWEKFDLGEADDPFTSGLLHDIGKVTMLMCLEDSLELVMALIEEEVQEAQGEGKMWAHQVVSVERFLMKDLDHQVIGSRLAEKWEVDPSIQLAVANHHDVGEHAPSIVKLTALADIAGNCLFPYPATDTQHPFPILFGRIDQALKKSSKQGPEAIEQIISEEIFEDLVDVLNRLELPNHLWELIDFKSFFKLVYVLAPKIKSATIGFMQQTA
ncbi:MAG: HDOD domain-containing protein [Gemmatimonadetes bacterium]|nr:HDOD domain-containing protein [Gemmatimonadota bacterium]MBT7860577.1 HDOD domain-containing protein [Gemmatimonadota bacterium]